MNNHDFSHQGGWTFWSMTFVLLVVGFFAYVGMQLVPVYSADSSVKNAMRITLDKADRNQITRSEIIRILDAQLYLDGNHELLNYKTDLSIKRSRNQLVLETHYQREIPLFLNLSLVAKFDNVEKKAL